MNELRLLMNNSCQVMEMLSPLYQTSNPLAGTDRVLACYADGYFQTMVKETFSVCFS
ncbi:mCG1051022 [Mus musculus]|nr:mCG1051022 [Mus musculus]